MMNFELVGSPAGPLIAAPVGVVGVDGLSVDCMIVSTDDWFFAVLQPWGAGQWVLRGKFSRFDAAFNTAIDLLEVLVVDYISTDGEPESSDFVDPKHYSSAKFAWDTKYRHMSKFSTWSDIENV